MANITKIHVLDVGQGNMVLAVLPNNTTILFDCNVSDVNRKSVLARLGALLPAKAITVFANTHRDADHLRGVADIHKAYPISVIWDSDITGTTPDTPEYKAYMALRRSIKCETISGGEYYNQNTGGASIRVLKSRNVPGTDPNRQSIVFKVQAGDGSGSSLVLPGDSDAVTWQYIMRERAQHVPCDLIVASHHGASAFFIDPNDTKSYYVSHIIKMAPAMCIISVGENPFGHPDGNALGLYRKYCSGSKQGSKIARTDRNGDVSVELRSDNTWSLTCSIGSPD